MSRQLEAISAACAQMTSSRGLQLVLAQVPLLLPGNAMTILTMTALLTMTLPTKVLLLGNAMNADTARGGAVGFGVEVLAQLMGVKSADQETTLMHYLVELTAARGVPAAALRAELRRVAEGAAVDLTEAAREVARLQEEVAALAAELSHCRGQMRSELGLEIPEPPPSGRRRRSSHGNMGRAEAEAEAEAEEAEAAEVEAAEAELPLDEALEEACGAAQLREGLPRLEGGGYDADTVRPLGATRLRSTHCPPTHYDCTVPH